MNLGRPDSPTAQRVAFADNPALLDEVTLLRDIVDTTRGAVTPKVAPATGAAVYKNLGSPNLGSWLSNWGTPDASAMSQIGAGGGFGTGGYYGNQDLGLFIGTPKGHNHFKELRDRAQTEDGWGLLEFKASETGVVDEVELKAAKNEMGQDKYLQEFECSFDASVEGSYYGTLLQEIEQKKHMQEIPREELSRTFTAWDLGMGDSTSIWVAQLVGITFVVV